MNDWHSTLQAHRGFNIQWTRQRFHPMRSCLSPANDAELFFWYERHHSRAKHLLVWLVQYPNLGTDPSDPSRQTLQRRCKVCR
jgi:hypothetical protein